MRRWLFNLATAVSLVLCVALAALWVRSYWRDEWWIMRHNRWSQEDGLHSLSLQANSFRGMLRLARWREEFKPGYFRVASPAETREVQLEYPAGLHWERGRGPGIQYSYRGSVFYGEVPTSETGLRAHLALLEIPHWLPVCVLLVSPSVWLYRFVRARRVQGVGLCPTCGYDLRATPERCPECGAVPGAVPRRRSDQRSELTDQNHKPQPASRSD